MEINERRVLQQVRNFERALTGYDNKEPLARYLTRFFKENRQMGSSDRKMTSRFCYNYFRLGNAYPQSDPVERLILGEFLCEQHSDLVNLRNKELADSMALPLSEKLSMANAQKGFALDRLFPIADALSKDIDRDIFFSSHFIQPNLFIRIKRGQEARVKDLIEKEGIQAESITAQTLALANGTKLQNIKGLNGLYEVQDLSSQYTLNFMESNPGENWWDTCAASGGKALMLLDTQPAIKLLVSDIRLSILRNLDERFQQAGIKQPYRKKVIDLTDVDNVKAILQNEQFDGVIVDAPCSGSGTWGRTPEMIQDFDVKKLETFTTLQKQIVTQVIPFLKKGKPLIYITCSVYKSENEDIVNYILTHFAMRLDKMEVIKGYENRADSMFAARLIKA
ncbi:MULTISPECIES: RsmB/NOP family class I SAM-dependent RNA methyltransferase [Sphingobacterium]|uniref:RsmB/NOP family class I SAM-dependent RNA methyltransferase n=1 Tax=Sphingobacterium TaxID=28453 RepID=UPI0013DBBE9E|nr:MULTISPECIES: RsmB/NOP family class I SAM-dependent RNA methyltransferase [unclassified Sphingobacterium]